jgi:hypothetical protein
MKACAELLVSSGTGLMRRLTPIRRHALYCIHMFQNDYVHQDYEINVCYM